MARPESLPGMSGACCVRVASINESLLDAASRLNSHLLVLEAAIKHGDKPDPRTPAFWNNVAVRVMNSQEHRCHMRGNGEANVAMIMFLRGARWKGTKVRR